MAVLYWEESNQAHKRVNTLYGLDDIKYWSIYNAIELTSYNYAISTYYCISSNELHYITQNSDMLFINYDPHIALMYYLTVMKNHPNSDDKTMVA